MSIYDEPNFDQCAVCKHHGTGCGPPYDGEDCWGQKIDPQLFEEFTGNKYEGEPEENDD